MKITKIIETEQEYEKALNRLEYIFDANPNSPEKKEADFSTAEVTEFSAENR